MKATAKVDGESPDSCSNYAQYVSKVRTYKKTLSLNEAGRNKVEECNFRKEFVGISSGKQSRGGLLMSIFEYDREWEEEEILRKEEFEAGKRNGRSAKAWRKTWGENFVQGRRTEEYRKERHHNSRLRKNAVQTQKMRADSENTG
ncbi:MAG: hypothetical protein ACLU6Y_03740 [Ruminococcus sp.]